MKSGESGNSTGTGLVMKLELLHKGYWYNGTNGVCQCYMGTAP